MYESRPAAMSAKTLISFFHVILLLFVELKLNEWGTENCRRVVCSYVLLVISHSQTEECCGALFKCESMEDVSFFSLTFLFN